MYCRWIDLEDASEAEEAEGDSLYSVESFEVGRMAVEAIQAEDCIIESEIISVEMAQMVEMLDEEDWKVY